MQDKTSDVETEFQIQFKSIFQVQGFWYVVRYLQCETVTYGSVTTNFFKSFNEKTEATTNYKLIITEFITNLLERQHFFLT